jgi:hypothetical protein
VQNLIRTLGLERDGDQEAKETDKDSEATSGILEQNSSSSSDRVLPRHRRRHIKGAI